MKSLVPDGAGQVRLSDVDEVSPAAADAVVAVEAFSVNRGETFLLDDPPAGWRPGKDIAGRVAREAADGTGPRAGTRVVGHPPSAGWAERAAVPVRDLVELPDDVAIATAAALPLSGLTALRLLRAAGPLIGRRLLVTGASGGVGHYVTELAVASGAEVTAVSATRDRGARLAALGALVIGDPAEAPGWYDIVLESVGGQSLAAARRKARTDGIVLWFGQAGRTPATVDFFDWIDGTAGAPIVAFHYQRRDFADDRDLATLVRLTAEGRLHPEIGALLPWEQTPEIIDAIRQRRLRGNGVLTLN
ncbi:MAG TPA: zinc-binding dehydrogenase [Trebonia sp.]|jgi:NADPH:quinone reductase-like Zn-dependent oxidoreductase|nr:zinc-binding dehydrogenase [Trebonia sp.]